MPSCAINGCRKNSRQSNLLKDGITFHRFPQCPIRRMIWADATGRDNSWTPGKYNYICSRHFHADFFTPTNRRRLTADAVPTLMLPIHVTPQPLTPTYDTPIVVKQEIDSESLDITPRIKLHKAIADLTLKVDTQAKRIKCLYGLNRRLRREVMRLLQEKEDAKCKCEKGNSDQEAEKKEKEDYVIIDESDEDDPLCIM